MSYTKKLPKYIRIYNDILKMINDGMYPAESKLPTENELAEQLNVSRMTLRKSLLLLKQDGVIENIQGSGNYVKKILNHKEVGIEEMSDILKKICIKEINYTEYNLELTPPCEYTKKIFNRESSFDVGVKRFHYDRENKVVAITLSVMLNDLLSDFGIKLEDFNLMRKFLEEDIYKGGFRFRFEMKAVYDSKMSEINRLESDTKNVFLIIENVYDNIGRLLIHTRHYIPLENVHILLNWYKL